MDSEFPRSELTVLTFADGEGQTHLALPLYEIVFRGETFSVALSSGSGLVVIRHAGDERIPVEDASLVEDLATQIRSLEKAGGEPTLQFRAASREGASAHFRAVGLVAHGGLPYIVAEDEAGHAEVFCAPMHEDEEPSIVSDAELRGRVLQIAEHPIERAQEAVLDAPARFTMRTPDGETRQLRPERSVQSQGNVYWLASDIEEEGRVYSLRQEPNGEWQPVTDAAEVERVRLALLQDG